MLVRFIRALCPQQRIDEYTPDAWHEVIGHLDFDDARNAVIAVKHSKPFVDTSDIVTEVNRAKRSAEAHPSARTVGDAVAAANRRELGAAPATPANAAFKAAVADMTAKLKARDERAYLASREAQHRAQDWIDYKLRGTLPREIPFDGTPAPRWQQLPGDPPELRSWLVRQARDGAG